MALTNDERQALIELKEQGYSFSEAMGFIASSRMGNTSRVSRDLLSESEPEEELGRFSDVGQDLKSGFLGVGKDLFQRGKNIVDSFRAGANNEQTPIETGFQTAGQVAGGVGDVAGRAVTTAGSLLTSQEEEDRLVEGIGEAVNRTGIPQAVDNLSERQKRNLSGGLGVFEGLTTGVGAGAAKSLTTAAKTGVKKIDDAATIVQKAGVTEGGAPGINQAISLGASPEDLMQRVARVSKKKQADFEDRAGESIGEYLVARDIFGTPEQIFDQLIDRMKRSKGRVDRRLGAIKGKYKDRNVKMALDELIDKESSIGVVGRDSAKLQNLAKKHKNEGLTLSEMNEVKRLYERNVKLDFIKEVNTTGIERANRIDTGMRNFIQETASKNGFTVVRDLNKETSLAKQLADDLSAEYSGSAGNNAVSITDWIILSEAATTPSALAGFAGKKLFSNKRVMSATARLMANNKGVKAELPDAQVQKEPVLSGYLKFLENQKGKAAAAGGVYFAFDENDNLVPAVAMGSILANPTARKQATKQLDDMIKDAQKVATDTNADKSLRTAATKRVNQLKNQKAAILDAS